MSPLPGDDPLLLVELIGEILRDASSKGAADGIDVVPVVVEGLIGSLALLRGIFQHVGVPFLVAGGLTEPGVIEGPAAANSGLFVGRQRAGDPRRLELERSSGMVKVRWEGTPIVNNPGDGQLLGALTALLAPELSGRRCAALMYEEDQLDADGRTLLWDVLLTGLTAAPGPTLPRVLILLVGSERISVEHHCRKGLSLRYALTREHGRAHRDRWETSRTEIGGLADDTDPVILFLGAGFSYSSGIPLSEVIRERALEQVLHETGAGTIDGAQLARRFFELCRDKDRLLPEEKESDEADLVRSLTLERVLREELHWLARPEDSPTLQWLKSLQDEAIVSPGDAATALCEFLRSTSRRAIILTVNFDQLVETCLGSRGRLIVDEPDFAQFARDFEPYFEGGGIPILKLHGTIDRLDTIVGTVEATAQGLSAGKTAALTSLASELPSNTTLIYIGYSMRDPDVNRTLIQKPFAEAFDERWVAPLPDPSVARFAATYRREIWRYRAVPDAFRERLITQSADVFCEELLARATSTT